MTAPKSDLESAVESLVERVDDLEARLDEERRARIDAEQRVEELQEELNDVQMWREGVSTWKDWANEEFETVRDSLEAVEQVEAETTAADDLVGLLPIEQLARMPDEVAKAQLDTEQSRNLYRARFIWQNMGELSQTVGKGEKQKLRVTSTEMMKALRVGGESGGAIDSKTTERIMDRLEDWTHGLAETGHTKAGERATYLPVDWSDRREEAERDDAGGVVSRGR